MDALDDEYLVVVQTQSATAHLAPACLEVVARQLHLLAVEQGVHLFVQQVEVQGVQVLKVVVAIGLARRLVAVHEVVVERYGDRLDAVGSKLHGESLAGRRLATARRTGDEHHAQGQQVGRQTGGIAAAGHLVGYQRYLLLLQGLAHLDELRGIAFLRDLVEIAEGAQSEDALPLVVLLEDTEHLVLMGHLTQLVGRVLRREA